MRCPYCDKEITSTLTYCSHCGQSIKSEREEKRGTQVDWTHYKELADNKRKSDQKRNDKIREVQKAKRKKIIAAMIASALVIAVIACINIMREVKVDAVITKAEVLAKNMDFEGALAIIDDGLANYPKSKGLQNKAEEYTQAWITHVISEAEASATDGDYETALSIVKARMVTFPESEELQSKAEEYTAELNTRIVNVYSGTYYTGVQRGFDLEILSCDYDGNIEAIFSFYSIDDDKRLFGSYKMNGNVIENLDDGSLRVSFEGSEWLEQPSGFYMIDLDITFNADKTSLMSEEYELYGSVNEVNSNYLYNDIVKTYYGTYKTGWGLTGLDLTILSCNNRTGQINAEFSFYPTEENPYAKTGRFSMNGRIAEVYDDGSLKIDLVADEWIESPGGWVTMIDFYLVINSDFDEAYSDDYQIRLIA